MLLDYIAQDCYLVLSDVEDKIDVELLSFALLFTLLTLLLYSILALCFGLI